MSRTYNPRKKHENMDKLSSISMASRAKQSHGHFHFEEQYQYHYDEEG